MKISIVKSGNGKELIGKNEYISLEEQNLELFDLDTFIPTNGYGACKSCKCLGWKPNNPKNDYCYNCGHHWEQHK